MSCHRGHCPFSGLLRKEPERRERYCMLGPLSSLLSVLPSPHLGVIGPSCPTRVPPFRYVNNTCQSLYITANLNLFLPWYVFTGADSYRYLLLLERRSRLMQGTRSNQIHSGGSALRLHGGSLLHL